MSSRKASRKPRQFRNNTTLNTLHKPEKAEDDAKVRYDNEENKQEERVFDGKAKTVIVANVLERTYGPCCVKVNWKETNDVTNSEPATV